MFRIGATPYDDPAIIPADSNSIPNQSTFSPCLENEHKKNNM